MFQKHNKQHLSNKMKLFIFKKIFIANLKMHAAKFFFFG